MAATRLRSYQGMRDFSRTGEPSGEDARVVASQAPRFVIQKHAASHLHFDLRLEFDGTFRSWAVPKAPSLDGAFGRTVIDDRVGILGGDAAVALMAGLRASGAGLLAPLLAVGGGRLGRRARRLARALQLQHQLDQFVLAQALEITTAHAAVESPLTRTRKPSLHPDRARPAPTSSRNPVGSYVSSGWRWGAGSGHGGPSGWRSACLSHVWQSTRWRRLWRVSRHGSPSGSRGSVPPRSRRRNVRAGSSDRSRAFILRTSLIAVDLADVRALASLQLSLARGRALQTVADPAAHGVHRAAAASISLRLLGEFSATFGDRPLPIATRKAKALLAYLAMSDSGHESRERLVGLLWSESDDERARASLRQAVHDLRAACDKVGFDGVVFGKQALTLRPGRLRCDVDEVLSSLADRQVHARLVETPRMTERLLDGFDDLDASFQVWVRAKRQSLQDMLVCALEAILPTEGCNSDAAAAALLNLDPTHEPACRHLIRGRAKRGDVGGAMRAYKTLWDLLESEFDIEPSQETQDLIVDLRGRGDQVFAPGSRGWSTPSPPRQATPTTRRGLSISVQLFDVDGVPVEQRYIVGGFRHELVACLARFREWSVRALPHRVETPAPSWSSPPEYVIEGTAYRAANALRLIMTFRDAATGVCVWSDQLSLSLSGWSDTQQHVVRRIAATLNVHLSAERLRRVAADGPVSLDIHDRWLRGQDLVHHLASSDWGIAAEIFEGLVRDAPDFAPGLTSLVQLRNTEHIAKPGHLRDRFRDDEVLRQARRAVHLDPLDARAQLNLAWTHQLAFRVDQSTLHAALAVELNGNDPWTLISAGQISAYCGDLARAEELAEASIGATPMVVPQQMTYLSAIKFLAGDYAGCIDAASRGLATSPGFRVWCCAALAHLGRRSEAAEELDRAFGEIALDWHGPGNPTPVAMSCWMLRTFPVAVASDWTRLRDGLAEAGAPVSSVAFGCR